MKAVRLILLILLMSLHVLITACKIDSSLKGSIQDQESEVALILDNVVQLSPNSGPTIIQSSSDVQVSNENSGSYSFDLANTSAPKCHDNGTVTINATTGEITFDPNPSLNGICYINVDFTRTSDSKKLAGAEFSVNVVLVNEITVSNLVVSNIISNAFTVTVDAAGDDNSNASLTLYYCENNSAPDCDPLSGASAPMSKTGSNYSANVVGLSTPYDPGDDIKIQVVASDSDGVTGSPLNNEISLSTGNDFFVSDFKIDKNGAASNSMKLALYFSGDANANATVFVYYCNDSVMPSCDPMAGSSQAMPLGLDYWGSAAYVATISLSGSQGDKYNAIAVVSDPDGTSGSPVALSFNQPLKFKMYPHEAPGFNKLPNNNIKTIKVDSTGKIYVGTDYGISISSDNGTTWTSPSGFSGLENFNIKGLFLDSLKVYAATFAGAYESSDGGNSWVKIAATSNGLGSNLINDVWVNGSNYYLAQNFAYSTDNSVSYSRKTTSDGLLNNSVVSIFGVGSTIYAGTNGGLSVTSDNGTTFSNFTTTEGIVSNSIKDVFVDSGNIYLATSGGLSVSGDAGSTWSNYTTTEGLAHNTVYDVVASGSNIYLATNGGVSVSTDAGSSWTNYTTTEGILSNNTRSIAIRGSNIYVGTTSGLSISFNSGASWTNISNSQPFSTSQKKGLVKIGSTFYTGDSTGLFKSTDGGLNWSKLTTAGGLVNNNVKNIAEDSGSIYVATAGGLSVTSDGGSSFTNFTTADGIINNNIKDLFISGSKIYLASAGGLSVSADSGTTWSNYTTTEGIISNDVRAVYADGSKVCLGVNGGISISENSGSTWSNYGTIQGIPHANVLDIYCQGSKLLVGTFGKLGISNDNGSTWASKGTSDGLGWNIINFVKEIAGVIYVGTGGSAGFDISWDGGDTFISHQETNTGHSGGVQGGIVIEGGKIYTPATGLNVQQ